LSLTVVAFICFSQYWRTQSSVSEFQAHKELGHSHVSCGFSGQCVFLLGNVNVVDDCRCWNSSV